MSESTTTEAPATEPTEGEGTGADKAFTQADVDRIIADRLKREDVKGLKSKAAEYDKLVEANKTAEQKAAEAQRAIESRAAEAEAKAIRYQVAAESGISKADADLFLTGTDEDTIAAQAKRLLERDADKQKRGNYVPNEGKTPKNTSDDPMRDFLRSMNQQ